MAYQRPPEPGTYFIQNVAAPKNVIEVPTYNEERAVCSPRIVEPAPNQQWYIQRSGRGYKIKNVKYSVYLSSYSAKPKNATPIGTSPSHGPTDWYILRTHDGFMIEYGETEMAVDLHYGYDAPGNPMHLWSTLPQNTAQRWKFERVSDDVGGELEETVEDRITALCDQLREKDVIIATRDAEITMKDRLLAQKERELWDALQSRREVPPRVIQGQLAEMRLKIDDMRYLVESCGEHPDPPNNTS
ncbi:hypothetical protein RSOLAG1IB_03632 [Rhizoctonia solani AG-1 IB]|uniref:Ricin B lectin domain-containing protein n=1 Tax=Thanatephorus cucumeris (strain AG1-IB / isolate 7/3/14) TaxID=1108050 RepID=A0A0B7FS43_THACB|nr:hypothetical protein RSOLAG1IB_03632 [Rhizoctonia solani AG-1 IB]